MNSHLTLLWQGFSDSCYIEHSDFILCGTCDILCDRFPGTWTKSRSKECSGPRSRSCLHCVSRSGCSTPSVSIMVSPLLCDAPHTGTRLTVCTHGNSYHCHTRPFSQPQGLQDMGGPCCGCIWIFWWTHIYNKCKLHF